MKQLISVIVPVYKVERYLDKCIRSIVDQTYRNLEIILVDDGSPDRCPQICDKWAESDARIKVIHKTNEGVSAARNTGLQAAKGDFIYFVDSDDVIVPHLCEKVMEIFSANDVEIVAFDCQRITEDGKLLGGTENLETAVYTKEEALTQLVSGKINDYLWSKVYKRDLFDKLRFAKHRTCFEDMEVTHRLLLKTNHIYCLNEQLYFYCQHSNSLTATMTAAKLCDLYQVRLERYRLLQENYPNIAEMSMPTLSRSALGLYDRSLWELADKSVVADARRFLEDNRHKVLASNGSIRIRIYYFMPEIYRRLRYAKHIVGEIVRYFIK